MRARVCQGQGRAGLGVGPGAVRGGCGRWEPDGAGRLQKALSGREVCAQGEELSNEPVLDGVDLACSPAIL